MAESIRSVWWSVARSEEITGKKPFAVDVGDQPIVMWRDVEGRVRALEDRCPHRRAPLSLGCIRDNGWIQCGYHGWSYDGETGRLRNIPNMKDEQRFPPVYKAQRFAVAESGGFVQVCLDPEAVPPVARGEAFPLSGTSHVALDQHRYLDVLFDDPSLLITIRGVLFTPYLLSELRDEGGRLVMERNCQWRGPHWPAAFTAEFPISLLSSTDPLTGETEFCLRDTDLRSLLHVNMAPVPQARGVTAVRWRAKVGTDLRGAHARLLGFGVPLTVHQTLDAAALRTLKPSVSLHGEDLRRATIGSGAAALAA